jgi:AraC-like DNA-binding protein
MVKRGTQSLSLKPALPVRALNAGLFVSRGQGTHATRTIDSHELIFVRSGVLGMFEEDRRFEVRAGEALHLWPGRRHGGTAPYPADLSFYWLHFRTAGRAARSSGAGELVLPQHARAGRPDRLTELLRRFLDDQESGRLTPLSGALLVTLILEETSGAGSPAAGAPASASGAEALAARADEFILTHFHEPISAWDVAAKLGCNPDYLGRVYRRMRRATLTTAINRARLRHARRLLLDSSQNIDELASSSGFSEAGYFRRVFGRAEGVTPSAFRRSYARMHMNTE